MAKKMFKTDVIPHRLFQRFQAALERADVTPKALANVSPGRGPRAGSPRGVGAFALKPWAQKCSRKLFATLMG
jgi:hypothetical protein